MVGLSFRSVKPLTSCEGLQDTHRGRATSSSVLMPGPAAQPAMPIPNGLAHSGALWNHYLRKAGVSHIMTSRCRQVTTVSCGSSDVRKVNRTPMRIRLIEPSHYLTNGKLLKSKRSLFPSLSLPYLAALAPSDVEVSVCIEQLEDIDFEKKTDIVGITSHTLQILRAYEIANEFRARGVPVVMGGVHVSMEPEEALEHADTVIVGEAEETWPQFINDFKNGSPKRLYRATRRPSLVNIPRPRYSLLDNSRFAGYGKRGLRRLLGLPVYPVQTARGCPNACEFCCVTRFYGSRYRHRPIREVIAEIKSLDATTIFFTDDDIFCPPRHARELFRALIPLRLTWFAQGSIAAAKDRELIRLARESGCAEIFVGLESLSRESLESVGKTINNVEEYERLLKVYRGEGICVTASLMFGFDSDSPSVFREALEFLVRNHVHHTFWWPVTPFPGTALFERLKKQGRLKAEKWWLCPELSRSFPDLKFTAIGMDETSFRENFSNYYNRFFSTRRILARTFLPPARTFLWRMAYCYGSKQMLTYG